MQSQQQLPCIRPIPADSVRQIVAGQVIFDLASAVKELIDNALDAQSTCINVRLFEQGLEIIEVSDDGVGVPAESRPLLATAHATSKLNNLQELYDCNSEPRRSLGFRGEALFSLANLCQNLIVLTRTAAEPLAQKLEFNTDGSWKADRVQFSPRKVGTTVAAVRLLSSIPVRRADLERRLPAQRKRMMRLMQGYAIFSTGIQIRLLEYNSTTATSKNSSNNGQQESVLLETPAGTTSLAQTISAVLGAKFLAQCTPVVIDLTSAVVDVEKEEDDGDDTKPKAKSKSDADAGVEEDIFAEEPRWKITGYLSKPLVAASSSSSSSRGVNPEQYFALNGRPVDLPKVVRLLNELWRTHATAGAQQPKLPKHASAPCVVWQITLPNHLLDINVAADKREVHFTHEASFLQAIETAVRKLWNVEGQFSRAANIGVAKSVAFVDVKEEDEAEEEEQSEAFDNGEEGMVSPRTRFNRRYAFARDVGKIRLQHNFDDGRKRHYSGVNMTAAAAQAVAELGDLADSDSSDGEDQAPRRPALLDMKQAAALAAAEMVDNDKPGSTSRPDVAQAAQQTAAELDYGYDDDESEPVKQLPFARRSGFSMAQAAAQAAAELENDSESEEDRTSSTQKPVDMAEAVALAAAELADDDESVDLQQPKRQHNSLVVSVTDTEEPIYNATPSPVDTHNPAFALHMQQPRVPESEQRLWRNARLKFNAISSASLSDDEQADDENDEEEGEAPTARDRRRMFLGQFQSGRNMTDRTQSLERYGFRSETIVREKPVITPGPPAAAAAATPSTRQTPLPKRRAVSLPVKEGQDELAAATSENNHNSQKVLWEGFGSAQQVTEAALAERLRMRDRKRALQETSREVEDDKIVKLHKGDFANLEIIGQFNLGFIIAKTRDNHLYILDQHACDEKYNFEKLCRETVLHEQRLIAPMPLELSPSEEACILEHTETFEKNGFRFKYDASKPPRHRFALIGLPHSGARHGRKAVQFDKDDVSALCSILSGDETHEEMSGGGSGADGSGMYGNNAVRRYAGRSGGETADRVIARLPKAIAMFASRACRSSIMVGKALSNQEMDRIVKKLQHVQHPWNCPHGRPTMRHLGDLTAVLADDEADAAEAIGNATVTVMTQDDAR